MNALDLAQTPELSRKNDRREGDPEAGQNDVETQRGRHLSTRRNHLDPGTAAASCRSQHLHCVHRDT